MLPHPNTPIHPSIFIFIYISISTYRRKLAHELVLNLTRHFGLLIMVVIGSRLLVRMCFLHADHTTATAVAVASAFAVLRKAQSF